MTRWAPWVQRRLDRIERNLSPSRTTAEKHWKSVTTPPKREVTVEIKRPKRCRMEASRAIAA